MLVQGAGGGVATALIELGPAAGLRVWATSRDEAKRERAVELGADAGVRERRPAAGAGGRGDGDGRRARPGRTRSRRCGPGGTIVISGATSVPSPPAELTRIFFLQLRVIGSTMGTRDELGAWCGSSSDAASRPVVDRVLPLAEARDGFAAMAAGDLVGKIVFELG